LEHQTKRGGARKKNAQIGQEGRVFAAECWENFKPQRKEEWEKKKLTTRPRRKQKVKETARGDRGNAAKSGKKKI